VPEAEEQDLPFERSSIAAIGARRRWWRLFGGSNEEIPDSGPPSASRDEDDDGPPGRSMLGRLADLAGGPDDGASAESEDDGPPVSSMLGSLAERAGATPHPEPPARSMLSLDAPAPAAEPDEILVGPLTQHSTIAELAGLEEHVSGSFPIERGILISIILHVALVLILVLVPTRIPVGSKGDLFAMFEPPPRDDTPIPVIIDAPGAPRPNPKPAPLSDADRRAGGGDRSRPKADTPYVPPSSGIAGLAPGPRAPRLPPGAPAPRPAPQGQRGTEEQAKASEKSEKTAEQKPSEFPSEPRPQATGPREIGKLAGLDRAIQEAARSAVGSGPSGEGGSPQGNPDGGFVDSGPLSFDTKWYDWGAYAAEMIRRIKLHWDVPELARLGWKGSLTIRFYIMADGRVADARIVRYSGIPPFDNAALQAILKSSPFRRLPDELHEDREGVTVTFLYNMRLDEEGKPQ
jgi:TonB family protein